MSRLIILGITIFTLFCGHFKSQTSTDQANSVFITKRKSLEQMQILMKPQLYPEQNAYTLNNSLENSLGISLNLFSERFYKLGSQITSPNSLIKFERQLGISVNYIENNVDFKEKLSLKDKNGAVKGIVQFTFCNYQRYVPSQEFGVVLKFFK